MLCKRLDGKYEEKLDVYWIAEYFEDPTNGLYEVEVFHHDVSRWFAANFNSLEEGQDAAREYYNNQTA